MPTATKLKIPQGGGVSESGGGGDQPQPRSDADAPDADPRPPAAVAEDVAADRPRRTSRGRAVVQHFRDETFASASKPRKPYTRKTGTKGKKKKRCTDEEVETLRELVGLSTSGLEPGPGDGGGKERRGEWTAEEDYRLWVLVSLSGSEPEPDSGKWAQGRWAEVAAEMPGRDAAQCRKRWTTSLDPSNFILPFTAKEDRAILLLQADAEAAWEWASIARILPGRTTSDVHNRWTRHLERKVRAHLGPRRRIADDLGGCLAAMEGGPEPRADGDLEGRLAAMRAARRSASGDIAAKARRLADECARARGGATSGDIAAKARRLAEESARARGGAAGAGAPARAALNQMWLECCGVADERGSISELKGMLEQFLSRAKAKASEKRPSCASKLEPPSKRTKTVTHRLVAYEKGGERQENQDAAATRAYKKWTEEEDERLKELVRGFGSERVRWAQLATEMPGRDFRRCEERWMRIDPSISQSPFTAEEDRAIVRFQANEDKAGKWAELAKSLPGRTRKQIRDRWRNTISKAASEPRQSTPSANAGLSQRKTPTEMATMATAEVVHKKGVPQEKNDVAATKKMNYWTDEEDERLIELVRGFGSGPKKWKQLAAEMPGREGKRCQERWLRIRPFTAEEDLAIFRFQANKDKAGKWAELAESLPGRTVGQIKKRWNWKQSAPSANADRDGAKIFEA